MFEVWLQMSDTNIDTENPSDLPALVYNINVISDYFYIQPQQLLVKYLLYFVNKCSLM